MNELTTIQATQEIIRLHNSIIQSTRRTVQDAIRIGEIITLEKERLEHGQFLPWIETLPFDQKTLWTYSRLYKHSDKIGNFPNLQAANKQIESLEAIEKRKEDERKQAMIKERIRTGEKPDGWDRSLDYEYNKRIEFGGYAKKIDSGNQEQKPRPDYNKHRDDIKALGEIADMFIEKSQERVDFKEKIRLSDNGKDDPFSDAIIDYLETLPDNNRKIEACYNIIKICKRIAVDLQAGKDI
jgi:hypothetical protein